MDISKLKNYLGHDCLFEVETTSSTPAISFKYNENPTSTISLLELCVIDPNGKCYHTILERDSNQINPITSHTIINDGAISLQYVKVSSTLYILPKSSSTTGKWQIYMRVFGSASLDLPPVASTIPSSGYSDVDGTV